MLDWLLGFFGVLPRAFASLGPHSVYISILVGFLVVGLILPWIRIFRRVGLSPGLGLLMFIPVVNLVVFLIFAYREWPIERENRALDISALMRM